MSTWLFSSRRFASANSNFSIGTERFISLDFYEIYGWKGATRTSAGLRTQVTF